MLIFFSSRGKNHPIFSHFREINRYFRKKESPSFSSYSEKSHARIDTVTTVRKHDEAVKTSTRHTRKCLQFLSSPLPSPPPALHRNIINKPNHLPQRVGVACPLFSTPSFTAVSRESPGGLHKVQHVEEKMEELLQRIISMDAEALETVLLCGEEDRTAGRKTSAELRCSVASTKTGDAVWEGRQTNIAENTVTQFPKEDSRM